jgi:arginyl-tRNA synthetase
VNRVESLISERLHASIRTVVGTAWDGDVPVEVSNRPDLGDYASGVAFQLARVAHRSPFELAQDLAATFSGVADELLEECSAVAPGFINFRLADGFLAGMLTDAYGTNGAIADSVEGHGTKIVIEHTNINPNKAAHVGHFRNACLGDSLARIFRRLGYAVEVQNYIDDTGVQVADIVVGLRYLGLQEPDDTPFDRFCSDVYVEVQQRYELDPELKDRRTDVQRAMETGTGDLARFAADVTRRIATNNLSTMARAGVTYDLLTWESDILGLGFWTHAFDRLRTANAVRLEDSGQNAGCWVLPMGEAPGQATAGEGSSADDKVLVTSRNVATYTAKDIAYQLWKFGLLGLDFNYRRWSTQIDGTTLWTGTRESGEPDAPEFAGADLVLNVIDASQSYPQQVVYESLRRLGYADAADHSEHMAYEKVSLAAEAARELGAEVPEGASVVAMTGRGGVQVFADELLDLLADKVRERTTDAATAEAIAVGAARYYMLKYSNNQRIAFDFEDALRTTGETGVYLQYAYVRASGIARKAGVAEGEPSIPESGIPALDRALALSMIRYPGVLAAAAQDRSVLTLAKYAFELATAFNAFYDNTTPVVKEEDDSTRAWRIHLVSGFRLVMGDVLDNLGIPRLDRI